MSGGQLVHQASSSLLAAWHYVVPPHGQRIPITLETYYGVWLPVPCMLLLAYLARRPNTHLLRLLVLPLAVVTCLRAAYAYVWTNPYFGPFNFAGGLFGLAAVFKALEWAIPSEGIKKIGEKVPGQGVPSDKVKTKANGYGNGYANGNGNGYANGNGNGNQNGIGNGTGYAKYNENGNGQGSFAPPIRPSRIAPISRGFYDAVELLSSLRGIGWEFGTGTDVYVPPLTFPTADRKKWVRRTLRHIFLLFLVTDFLEACLKLHPSLRTPQGGSIILPSISPIPRYALSTLTHFATGCAFIAGFTAVYYILAVSCVLLLSHDPAQWPPIFEQPWLGSSLHDFWARRWHQLLRQTFLVMGGYPLQRICHALLGKTAGKVGLVVGAFVASGFYHCWAMYAMGSTDWSSVWFFGAQGLGVGAERVWKRVTGRRVRGFWGTLWAYFWVIGIGQFAIDGWHRRGLGGGMIIPPFISPTRLLVFPLLWRAIEYFWP